MQFGQYVIIRYCLISADSRGNFRDKIWFFGKVMGFIDTFLIVIALSLCIKYWYVKNVNYIILQMKWHKSILFCNEKLYKSI